VLCCVELLSICEQSLKERPLRLKTNPLVIANASARHSRDPDPLVLSELVGGPSPLLCAPALRPAHLLGCLASPRLLASGYYTRVLRPRSSRTSRAPLQLQLSAPPSSQVLVCPLGGTAYWGHPLGESNGVPAPTRQGQGPVSLCMRKGPGWLLDMAVPLHTSQPLVTLLAATPSLPRGLVPLPIQPMFCLQRG
jgi:hypothetical protein